MPEAETQRRDFMSDILNRGGSPEDKGGKGHTSAGAGEQAFLLRADFKDGRRKRGVGWSHFSDYEWEDLGEHEKLTVLFGDRIVTIIGHNLEVLCRLIDKGKLEAFEERITAELTQLRNNPPRDEALVKSVEIYPEFGQLIAAIKGEDDDKGRHARRVQR